MTPVAVTDNSITEIVAEVTAEVDEVTTTESRYTTNSGNLKNLIKAGVTSSKEVNATGDGRNRIILHETGMVKDLCGVVVNWSTHSDHCQVNLCNVVNKLIDHDYYDGDFDNLYNFIVGLCMCGTTSQTHFTRYFDDISSNNNVFYFNYRKKKI